MILRAMNAFLAAIVRWYGEMKPPEVEAEEEEEREREKEEALERPTDEADMYPTETPKPPPPEQITMTENILLRLGLR